MTRVLIVKTSSLGDVIHTLPAINDAVYAIPDIKFDWIVEENFSEIPNWNSDVDQIIPVVLRKWRKNIFRFWFSKEWSEFKKRIGFHRYDVIIDAQGLLKSAWLGSFADGPRYGFDKFSAREPLASNFYDHQISVSKKLHAVERTRILFSKSLGYSLQPSNGKYNLSFGSTSTGAVVLIHGTTWASKHWPEESWIKLSGLLTKANYKVFLPWANEYDRARALRISKSSGAKVLPKMTLTEIASFLAESQGCVSVDTGLGHLSSALNTPTLGIFGPTDPSFTGLYGPNQKNLLSDFPCLCMTKKCPFTLKSDKSCRGFEGLTANRVFDEFIRLMNNTILSGKPCSLPTKKESNK